MALDKTALASIQELDPGGNLGLIKAIIRTFNDSISSELAQLETHHKANLPELVAQSAHRFKSSCLNVGANDVARLLRDLEMKKNELSFDQRDLILDEITVLVKSVKIELLELAQNLPADAK